MKDQVKIAVLEEMISELREENRLLALELKSAVAALEEISEIATL